VGLLVLVGYSSLVEHAYPMLRSHDAKEPTEGGINFFQSNMLPSGKVLAMVAVSSDSIGCFSLIRCMMQTAEGMPARVYHRSDNKPVRSASMALDAKPFIEHATKKLVIVTLATAPLGVFGSVYYEVSPGDDGDLESAKEAASAHLLSCPESIRGVLSARQRATLYGALALGVGGAMCSCHTTHQTPTSLAAHTTGCPFIAGRGTEEGASCQLRQRRARRSGGRRSRRHALLRRRRRRRRRRHGG
jgi:hypothetical protein